MDDPRELLTQTLLPAQSHQTFISVLRSARVYPLNTSITWSTMYALIAGWVGYERACMCVLGVGGEVLQFLGQFLPKQFGFDIFITGAL